MKIRVLIFKHMLGVILFLKVIDLRKNVIVFIYDWSIQMIENNKIKIIGLFASILFLMLMITASFAYFGTFSQVLNRNVAVNINTSSVGEGVFTSSATQLNFKYLLQV